MIKHVLVTNPKVRVLHRKGVFFAGQLSGAVPPVQLAELDIILLFMFLKGGEPDTIATQCQSGELDKFLPVVPPPDNILHRISQLEQAQVLVSGNGMHEQQSTYPCSLEDCKATLRKNGFIHLRLSSNFALEPTPAGFQLWHPVARKYHLLSLELTLLLMSFSTGKTINEVVAKVSHMADESSCIRGVSWLNDQGLLVQENPKTVATTQQRVEAKKKHKPRQSNTNKPKGMRWQDLKPDDRIPVYFAPHMRNHYPLALGMIHGFVTAYKEGAHLEKFQLLPISYMNPNDLLEGPYRKFGKGVWLFSNYMWSVDVNLRLSQYLKILNRQNLIIHGGPSTPSYRQSCAEFMDQNRFVDIAVHGEGEVTAAEILDTLMLEENGNFRYSTQAMAEVDGLTFRIAGNESGELCRTNDRVRLKELDDIPSPYTSGIFDLYGTEVDAAIIESNRGCPFGCTFCDWGSATKQKVRKFNLERTKEEIEWIGRNGTRILWVADANFGMYDRDIELSEWICKIKKKYGFPREVVVNYTKNATKRLAEIVRIFTNGGIISQGIISIQTTDEVTLDVINRKNIKIEKYDELTKIFADEGLPLSTDLMIGLPGITVDAFDRDLQRYIDVDITAKAYPTKLLPNSPMADPEYIKKYEIEVDEEDFLVSCYSYTRADLDNMKLIYHCYEIADGYSALRYVLRYLQWEHNISALTFLHKMRDGIKQNPTCYPSITWLIYYFKADKCMPGGWKNFYDEIAQFVNAEFDVQRDSAFDTVLYVNELVMPDDLVMYPLTVQLDHDFVAYFLHHNAKSVHEVKHLHGYSKADFTVDDPDSLACIDAESSQYDTHQYFWELRSLISRNQSASGARGINLSNLSG